MHGKGVGLSLLCGIMVFGVILACYSRALFEEVLFSTKSPQHCYRVDIVQTRPFPFFERAVFLSAYREHKHFVKKLLYTGDFLDNDFRDLYPNPRFSSEFVYELGTPETWKGETLNESAGDLRIVNDTSNNIDYLLVETTGHKLVIFDIKAGTVISDLSFEFAGWRSCQGQFSESSNLVSTAVSIPANREENSPRRFTIRLRADAASIESQPRVLPTTCCAPDRPDVDHESWYP